MCMPVGARAQTAAGLSLRAICQAYALTETGNCDERAAADVGASDVTHLYADLSTHVDALPANNLAEVPLQVAARCAVPASSSLAILLQFDRTCAWFAFQLRLRVSFSSYFSLLFACRVHAALIIAPAYAFSMHGVCVQLVTTAQARSDGNPEPTTTCPPSPSAQVRPLAVLTGANPCIHHFTLTHTS